MSDLPARERLAKAAEFLETLCDEKDMARALSWLKLVREVLRHVECVACGAWVPRDDRDLCHMLGGEPYCFTCAGDLGPKARMLGSD